VLCLISKKKKKKKEKKPFGFFSPQKHHFRKNLRDVTQGIFLQKPIPSLSSLIKYKREAREHSSQRERERERIEERERGKSAT
jgi:hypothetical protein